LIAAGLMAPAVAMPDEQQLAALLGFVSDRYPAEEYPALMPANDQTNDFTAQFRRALLALSFMRRRDDPDTTRYPSFWLDRAANWLKRFDQPSDISLPAFVAACAASDVAVAPLTECLEGRAVDRLPFVEIGLAIGEPPAPIAGWPDVLGRRGVLAPRELPARAMPSPITVPTITSSFVGDRSW
jgi:hypothetical protein